MRDKSALRNTIARFGPALLVLGVTLGLVLLVLNGHNWDPMAFVRLGTRYSEGAPQGTIGYDGQFAYQIAIHPSDAAPYLDIPAYRYQRILYPLLGRLVALGQPALIPWALLGINVAALTIGTHVAAGLLAARGLNRWYAVTVGLFAGQLVSLRMDLNEPCALTLALLGVRAFEKSPRRGAILFAASLLCKETALAFVGGYLIALVVKKRWRPLAETGIISLGPFLAWQAILWYNFGEPGLRSGGQGATAFSPIPFAGMFAFPRDDPKIFLTSFAILGPLVLLPCLALTVALLKACFRRACGPPAIVLALHVIMMATMPFSTYVDLPGVLRLTSGLVVSTLIFAAFQRARRILNYSMLWLASAALLPFVW